MSKLPVMKQFIIKGINEFDDDSGFPLYWSNVIDPLSDEDGVVGWTNLWNLDFELDYYDISAVNMHGEVPVVGGGWQSIKNAKLQVEDTCEINRESIVHLTDGYMAVTPAYPAECDFVKVITELGEEVAYWIADEWEEAPTDVMGAIFGLLKDPKKAHEILKKNFHPVS